MIFNNIAALHASMSSFYHHASSIIPIIHRRRFINKHTSEACNLEQEIKNRISKELSNIKIFEDLYLKEKINEIAKECHNEIKRILAINNSEYFVPEWEDCDEIHRKGVMYLVMYNLKNPKLGVENLHYEWMQKMINNGWVYGKEKNIELKTSPNLLNYEELPIEIKYLYVVIHSFARI